MEQVDVEGMALNPFAAVEQSAQRDDGGGDLHTECLLQSLTGGQLVGDRTDAADSCGDVGHLGESPATEEPFEESGRFVDVEFGNLDAALIHANPQRALSFDTRERLHVEAADLTHGGSPPACRSRPGRPAPRR